MWLASYTAPACVGGSEPTQFTDAKLYQFAHFLARRQADGSRFGRLTQLSKELRAETAGAIDWDARQVGRAVQLVGFSQHGYTYMATQRDTPHNIARTADFLEFRAGVGAQLSTAVPIWPHHWV